MSDTSKLQSNSPTVYAESENFLADAVLLAERLGLPFEREWKGEFALRLGKDGLALVEGNCVLPGDFGKMLHRLKANNLSSELPVKAAKIKGDGPFVAVDATAGLGEDSLLLAAAGFTVIMFEYNPIIAALLDSAMRRAAQTEELAEVVSRMTLINGDSIKGMPELAVTPDVILLDPMFPSRQKSALVKKKFQLLHNLERPCGDEGELLAAAIAARPQKIVIKRPPLGPYLAGVKPTYSLTGKAVRYDCLSFPRGETEIRKNQ